MATTAFLGSPVQTVGALPAVGTAAPAVALSGADLSDITLDDYRGRRVLLNIFPSIDTDVCATSVRTFNQRVASLDNTTVICASKDLPFALGRFCGAEGIENVVVGSAFRTNFGEAFGVTLLDSPLAGLLARSVVVIDEDGKVVYTELVPEITTEPDYEAAIAALA